MPEEWETASDRGLGPLVTHVWATQPECERSSAMFRRIWGQYVAVCPRFQLTSHTQETSPFENNVVRGIFSERSVFVRSLKPSLLLTMFPLVFIYVLCSMLLYNVSVYQPPSNLSITIANNNIFGQLFFNKKSIKLKLPFRYIVGF